MASFRQQETEGRFVSMEGPAGMGEWRGEWGAGGRGCTGSESGPEGGWGRSERGGAPGLGLAGRGVPGPGLRGEGGEANGLGLGGGEKNNDLGPGGGEHRVWAQGRVGEGKGGAPGQGLREEGGRGEQRSGPGVGSTGSEPKGGGGCTGTVALAEQPLSAAGM